MRRANVVVLLLCLLGVMIPTLRAAEADAQRGVIAVVVTGSGLTEKDALAQALSNAVQQAVGTIVDAETVAANDTVIKDQVLTASNAIVEGYDAVGAPAKANGLVTIKIKARVLRKQLTEKLAAANVVSAAVEGKDLAAQLQTDLARENDAAAIVRRSFQDFPGNVLKAEPVGQPRVIKKGAAETTVGVTIRLSYDEKKYQQWYAQVVPFLAKVATQKRELRWNPTAAADRVTIKVGKDAYYLKELKKHVPDDALRLSVEFGRGLGWVPAQKGEDDRPAKTLAIFERSGSTRGIQLHLDEPAHQEVARAACALPILELVLKDKDGAEIDGQLAVAAFKKDIAYYAAPFFEGNGYTVMPGGFYGGAISPHWKPDANLLTRRGSFVVAPYIGGVYGNDSNYIVPAITVELPFKLTPEQLAQVNKVEARVSSQNNAPHAED